MMTPVLQHLTALALQSKHLTQEQISLAVEELVSEARDVSAKAEFLAALSAKGETPEEIAGFARELRRRAVQATFDESTREILDVVGTGGDRLSTFNISTTVAILAAAAGVLVAKHGNRASTSSIGSADVMEALGLPFDLDPAAAVASLRSHGFTYFFAPRYHPCFKHIIPARKICAQRGQATVFNYLGPLLNPGRPTVMLVGVPRPELCEPLARVLQSLGVRRGMVVSGAVCEQGHPVRYLDEISPLGPTTVAEFYHERGLNCSTIEPSSFELQPVTLRDLQGGDRIVNATIIQNVLSGKERGPKRDAVLLNAAAALFVAQRAHDLSEGWDIAAETISSGAALKKLVELRESRGIRSEASAEVGRL